jgi:hypothetical protein|tara:strand:- start:1204 stop:1527 length:324 start_codon:yes stop_codon:yes gene_type:complete
MAIKVTKEITVVGHEDRVWTSVSEYKGVLDMRNDATYNGLFAATESFKTQAAEINLDADGKLWVSNYYANSDDYDSACDAYAQWFTDNPSVSRPLLLNNDTATTETV